MQDLSLNIYYTVDWTRVKSSKSLSSSSGSGDTKYSQKQVKFTTFEAHFDLHGCFVSIIMLQIFRNIVGHVSVSFRKPIKAEDLRLWSRPMWDTKIYWRCVQFTVKWARSHAFRSTISRSHTSTLATSAFYLLK